MSDQKEIQVCPFCGKAWEKPEKPRYHSWLHEMEKTIITIVTTTAMVLLLRWLGI